MVWRLGWLVTLLACQDVPRQLAPEVRFVDVTVASGIEFHHVSGAEGDYNYPETFGSGVAWLDVDGIDPLPLAQPRAFLEPLSDEPGRRYLEVLGEAAFQAPEIFGTIPR